MANETSKILPAMFEHKGTWEGVYRHLDADANIIEIHESHVECIFPDEGEYSYIQRNLFTWDDGREYRAELSGVLKGDRLYWDEQTFSGYAWETSDNIIMLNLNRKDEPGASFVEVIIMGDTGKYRTRTWHWFKNGQLYKRTICEENRVDQD